MTTEKQRKAAEEFAKACGLDPSGLIVVKGPFRAVWIDANGDMRPVSERPPQAPSKDGYGNSFGVIQDRVVQY